MSGVPDLSAALHSVAHPLALLAVQVLEPAKTECCCSGAPVYSAHERLT